MSRIFSEAEAGIPLMRISDPSLSAWISVPFSSFTNVDAFYDFNASFWCFCDWILDLFPVFAVLCRLSPDLW
jgi:hypothetical protein